MKRVGFIYEKICDIENIKTAIKKASKRKRHRRDVKKILDNIDIYAEKIKKMLEAEKWTPSPYTIKHIKDGVSGKERVIHKPKFYPDQCIHWALMLQIQDILSKKMYFHSIGSRPGKGTKHGQKYLRKWIDKDPKNTKYVLKLDIHKFYPSVNQDILINQFKDVIKDKKVLNLISLIIRSIPKGLPIGNYTSQWFANFHLTKLDHFIKKETGANYHMIRYIDDIVITGPNKRQIRKLFYKIQNYVNNIGLKIKPDWQIWNLKNRDIDFLGLRFKKDRTILRKKNALRIKRRTKKIAKKPSLTYKDACAVISYWGWIKRSDSFNFYNKNFKPYVNIKAAKRRISYESKKQGTAKRSGSRSD